MLQTLLSRLGWFVLLILLQALVFGHIHLLGYATPLPYVYFILLLSNATPRWVFVATGFAMGLCIDLFNNTPGMAAASLCACGLIAPPLLKAFTPADKEDEEIQPSARTLKWSGFLRYATCIVLLHCTLFFTIEAFTFSDWQTLLLSIGGSSVLTFIVILGLESLRSSRKSKASQG